MAKRCLKYLRVYECPRCTYDTKGEEYNPPVLSLDKWCPACMREIRKGNEKIVWAFPTQKPFWDDYQMINPTELYEKLLNYPETNLLPKEREAIDMILNLLRQLFGFSIDKLPKEQQLSLIKEIVKDCKEYLVT